jgi:peptidoglycan/LPS O-acetylase OafA/YrhL
MRDPVVDKAPGATTYRTSVTQGKRIHGLDGLRGLAALSVVGFHAHTAFDAFPNWWGKGYLAVDFFMMLSGYVMARTYEERMREGLGAAAFFKLRYRRLWLTMAIGSLIGIPYLWALTDDPLRFTASLVLNLALIPAPLNNELFPLNGPAWSIFYELLANVLHVVLFWRLSSRVLLTLAIVLLMLLGIFAQAKGDVDFGALAPAFAFTIVRSLAAYTCGILLWRHWRDEPGIKVPAALPFIALPLLMLTPFTALGWAYDLAFIALACPLLIAGGLRLHGVARWAAWSGALSFPLYAVHAPVLRAAVLAGIDAVEAALLAVLAGIALTWWLSHRQQRAKRMAST